MIQNYISENVAHISENSHQKDNKGRKWGWKSSNHWKIYTRFPTGKFILLLNTESRNRKTHKQKQTEDSQHSNSKWNHSWSNTLLLYSWYFPACGSLQAHKNKEYLSLTYTYDNNAFLVYVLLHLKISTDAVGGFPDHSKAVSE